MIEAIVVLILGGLFLLMVIAGIVYMQGKKDKYKEK